MENFNAGIAKEIANSFYSHELNNILSCIKKEAKEGRFVLHIYESIKASTRESLTKKGFRIITQPSIAIQRDGLYYSIHWD